MKSLVAGVGTCVICAGLLAIAAGFGYVIGLTLCVVGAVLVLQAARGD